MGETTENSGLDPQPGRYTEFSPLHRLTRAPDLGALTNIKASFELLTTHRLSDTIPLAWRSEKLSALSLRDLEDVKASCDGQSDLVRQRG